MIALNTPVVATHSGQVIFAGWRTDGYGNLIILQNGTFITYYAHLTDFNVVTGQIGRAGQRDRVERQHRQQHRPACPLRNSDQ